MTFDITAWHAEKEATGWRPYHVGTTPRGLPCSASPRCVPGPTEGTWRCPACGKVFPTATAEMAARISQDP